MVRRRFAFKQLSTDRLKLKSKAISTNLSQDWTVVTLLRDITWKLPTTKQRSAYCLQKRQRGLKKLNKKNNYNNRVGSISALFSSPVRVLLCLVPVRSSPRASMSIDFGDSDQVTRKGLTEEKYRGLGARQCSSLKRVEECGLLSRTHFDSSLFPILFNVWINGLKKSMRFKEFQTFWLGTKSMGFSPFASL